jgi:hypothetical protein
MTETERTAEALEIELIALVGCDHMSRGLTLRAASLEAEKLVKAYRAAVLEAWTPATGGMPELPKLVPGDELLVVQEKTRYRPQYVQGAEVVKMARFRVTLRYTSLENGREYTEDFDVRTQHHWDSTPAARRMSSVSGARFYTAGQWAWEQRARRADDYLKERGIYPSSVRGPLSGLLHEDRVGFANALRRLEGLVEL